MRITCLVTNTTGRPIAELELRHLLRARAEDRIRATRATGLRNLPLHDTAQNRIWLEIVQIALDLLAWMPMLALTDRARLWEPRRLPFRLFPATGQFVTTSWRRILRLARHWPWTGEITATLGTARAPARPRLTSNPPSLRQHHLPRAVEPGTHSTRQPGRRPAPISSEKRKGPPTPSTDPRERSRLIRIRGATHLAWHLTGALTRSTSSAALPEVSMPAAAHRSLETLPRPRIQVLPRPSSGIPSSTERLSCR